MEQNIFCPIEKTTTVNRGQGEKMRKEEKRWIELVRETRGEKTTEKEKKPETSIKRIKEVYKLKIDEREQEALEKIEKGKNKESEKEREENEQD